MKVAALMPRIALLSAIALAAIVAGDDAPRPIPAAYATKPSGASEVVSPQGGRSELRSASLSASQDAAPIIEAAINGAYSAGLSRVYLPGTGLELELRIPFGENGERRNEAGLGQSFLGGGKASPSLLWPAIEAAIATDDFLAFMEAVKAPETGAILINIASGTWSPEIMPPMENLAEPSPVEPAGAATEAAPIALVPIAAPPPEAQSSLVVRLERPWAERKEPPSEAELRGAVYDYLYCIASVGMDCSGFVFHIESALAEGLGADLWTLLAPALGLSAAEARTYAGIRLLDPANGLTQEVGDRVADLRPGDIILFRGRAGAFRHSAVIASIDRQAGFLHYVQSTDWAPREERGVHASVLAFDHGDSRACQGDASVRWSQAVWPAFPGETEPSAWKDDGDRFGNDWSAWGRGTVVRLDAVRALVEAIDPGFYATASRREEKTLAE